MNQIISYMYVLKAEIGGFIVPSNDNEYNAKEKNKGKLNGYGGDIYIWRLSIPQQTDNFLEFCNRMKENEKWLINFIKQHENSLA
jgi:5-methylcytosine-specific restriction enzyme subunit McrC